MIVKMKKMKLLVLTVILVLLLGSISIVKAETNSLNFTPEPSTKTLKEGEEIAITLKVSDIKMGDDGINTFGGKLVYDENIFEKVKNANFISQNNWSVVYNDEETDKKGTFLATINSGAKTDQTIATLKLKVKTNLKSTTTKIQFTELSSVAEDEVNLPNKVINLNITGTVKEEEKNEQINTENNNTSNNETTNNNVTNNTNTTNKNETTNNTNTNATNTIIITTNSMMINNQLVDNTIAEGKIPQTGIELTYIIIKIIAPVIVSVVSYLRVRKNKDI